ncbi:hypothetical protein MMC21_001695 [Puttea exsequens]|nr:hypothetical protein [Puttea exsequens]
MVKFHENSFNYDYPFPAVSLAYFLRYPNPYATHVLSTDVIDRHFDAATQRLSTTRLHLKRSKIPPVILKLLPKGIIGNDGGQSYVVEKSVVDVREGWMKTETRNLEWTGILSVVEKQVYRRPSSGLEIPERSTSDLVEATKNEGTDVTTTTTLLSRFGQAKLVKRREEVDSEEEPPAKKGVFSTWSTTSLQRTIEMVGLRRTREALAKSKDGMNVVLGRLRHGGLVQVLEGMQEDSQRAFGQDQGSSPWKRAWQQGQDSVGELGDK